MTVKESLVSSNNRDDFLPNYQKPSLFMTPAWQQVWWRYYGSHINFSSFNDFSSPLIYIDQHRLFGLLKVKTAQPYGYNRHTLSTPRSEYLSLGDGVKGVLMDNTTRWDEAVFPDVVISNGDFLQIKDFSVTNKLSIFLFEKDTSYAINTGSGSFASYVKRLSANTRRRFYNQRKRLQESGTIVFENYWPERATLFFSILNNFHLQRYGIEVYSVKTTKMFNELCENLEHDGGSIYMDVMLRDNIPISVSFDIEWLTRRYNLQSGFKQGHQSLSLGLLHLGYRIEDAFSSPHTNAFDLMCGSGKSTRYKSSIATCTTETITIVIVKSFKLKLIYHVELIFMKTKSILRNAINFRINSLS